MLCSGIGAYLLVTYHKGLGGSSFAYKDKTRRRISGSTNRELFVCIMLSRVTIRYVDLAVSGIEVLHKNSLTVVRDLPFETIPSAPLHLRLMH